MHTRRFVHTVAIAALTTGIGVTTTRADVILSIWNSSTSYNYWTLHVPDFDQRRTGLPGNGSQHCVPTACMNWMAYFATHGDPSLPPGTADWQSVTSFPAATTAIETMGALMNTDPGPGGGTSGANGIWGLGLWLSSSNKPYIAFRYSRDADWAPRLRTLAHHAVQGGYVAPCVGWYDVSNYPILDQQGGHCVSLVRAVHSPSGMQIGVTDPAADGGDPLSTQSTFMMNTYFIQDEFVFPDGPPFGVSMSKVIGYTSGSQQAYVKALYVIYPAFVLSSFDGDDGFNWTFPSQPSDSASEDMRAYAAPAGGFMMDMAMHADASSVFALVEQIGAPTGLYEVDPVTGAWTQVDLSFEGPKQLHMGRMRDLYVLDATDIACIAVDPDTRYEVARVTPPQPPIAITSNDDTDEIVVLTESRLWLYPYNLGGSPVAKALPAGFPTEFSDGGAFRHDPTRNGYWVVTQMDDDLHFLKDDGAGGLITQEYSHEEIVLPWTVDVDDEGRLYVSTEGAIKEFVTDGNDLVKVTDPRYQDVCAGRFMQVARSRTNHDPALHEGPAWSHLEPDGFGGTNTVICPADLDLDGIVSFADLTKLLQAWGECPTDAFCVADLDYNGTVGFSDLVALLNAWGACR